VDLAGESVLGAFAWTADGSRVAASYESSAESRFGLSRMWSLAGDPGPGQVLPHQFTVAAFSTDGSRLATADLRRVRVWRAADAAPQTTWFVHPWTEVPPPADAPDMDPRFYAPYVYGLAWSKDGRRLVTVAGDAGREEGIPGEDPLAPAPSTVVLWDVRGAAPLSRAFPHPAHVSVVLVSPAGDVILTAGEDGGVRRLRVVPDLRPAARLLELAEVLALRRVDESGTLVDLDDADLLRRFAALGDPER
jgi:WD40 repeat protein